METQRTRDDSIDFLRGIAVLLVIFGHYFSGKARLAIFAFHIPLFLMISGYLCHIDKSEWSYLRHQMKRILPTYFICIVMMTTVDLLKGNNAYRLIAGVLAYANPDMDRSLIQLDVGIGPIWFLPAMIVASFIGFVLIKYLNDYPIWMFGMSLFISIGGGGVLGKIILLPFDIDNGIELVIFFVIGYLLRYQANGIFTSDYIGFVLFFIGESMAQLIGIQSYASRIYPKFPLCVAVSIATTYGFFILAKHSYRIAPKNAKKIAWLIGKNSMTVLFVHTLEFEYLLDSWASWQICSISIVDQLLHGCISCIINILILVSFIKIKSEIIEYRGRCI